MIEGKAIVFVVDHDLAVRDSLKFFLALEGLAVRACGSGADLLRHPDLRAGRCLAVECEMPAMDGFEVIARLAALGTTIPVILLTNYATPMLYRRAREAGVRFVLEKPLMNGSLLEKIREVLQENLPNSVASTSGSAAT